MKMAALTPLGVGIQRNNFQIIEDYFSRGFQYKKILALLERSHNYRISLRQLHRILRSRNLHRKRNASQINVVIPVMILHIYHYEYGIAH